MIRTLTAVLAVFFLPSLIGIVLADVLVSLCLVRCVEPSLRAVALDTLMEDARVNTIMLFFLLNMGWDVDRKHIRGFFSP
jgi:hypothetical protein